jgi:predicted dehydrogenase
MSQERARAGVVGTGWWAELEHLPGLQSRGDVEVTALCGRNAARLAELADRFQVAGRFTDWRDMLARARLDLVVIVTPNGLHHPIALAALDAGAHVVCEKPLALDAGQAREMAARAQASGRHTLTFFTHRALAAAAQAKRLVDQGFLGRPLHVSACYFSASHLKPGKPAAWRMRRAEAGSGVLGDIGSHLVDLVRWWLGDVTRVAGQWQTIQRERAGGAVDGDEDCSFLAQLACGAQAVFQASKLVAGRGNWQRVELHGDRGSLVYQAEPGVDATWEGRLWAGRPDRIGLEPVALPAELTAGLDATDPMEGRLAAYRRLTDPFLAAVRAGPGGLAARAHPDFADGAAVQAVLDAVAASAERGSWVEVA